MAHASRAAAALLLAGLSPAALWPGAPLEGPFAAPPSLASTGPRAPSSALATGAGATTTAPRAPLIVEGGGFPLLAPVTRAATTTGPYRYSRRLLPGAPPPPPVTLVFPKRIRPAGKTARGIRYYGSSDADLARVRAFGRLHAAVYDATGVTDPMALYDTLSLSMGGELLDREFQKQLGGNARLADEGNRVVIHAVVYERVAPAGEGRLRVAWWLSGRILHQQHVHMRLIRFEGIFTVAPASGPKSRIVALDLVGVKPY